jgi:uncharacterized ion transporter superfamily protein YfcC
LLDSSERNSINNANDSEKESVVKKKGEGCQFPSSFTIILIIYTLIFLLTYIVPKGKYDTIEYSSGKFIIKSPNEKEKTIDATKDYLDKIGIKVPLSSFENGFIKSPISIPNTFKRITGENTNIAYYFLYPILGFIDSADISFFIMLLGGSINILNEMDALSSGIRALSRITKGRGFLLLSLVYLLISIGANTYGMSQEVMAFFPILMPIFLKSGIDAVLGTAALYVSIFIGNMFSTVNAFSVVVAAYSAGITFIDGIVFRIICLVIMNTLTLLYFYLYYRKVKNDEKNSIVYDIKKQLEDKYLKDDKNEENNDETEMEKLAKENKADKFTCKQKIALFIFFCAIIGLVIGVILFNWWFEHMSAIFLLLGIILMFFLGQSEKKAVKVFMKGIADFADFAVLLGFSRAVNITLAKGNISDTILYGLTNIVTGLPKVVFAAIMFIIFILLGLLIAGWTGLAILAIPVLAPLADEANCSRDLVINAYLFGQSFIQIISPTSVIVIAEFVGIQYNHWLKFIYPYMIILFFILLGLIMLNSLF